MIDWYKNAHNQLTTYIQTKGIAYSFFVEKTGRYHISRNGSSWKSGATFSKDDAIKICESIIIDLLSELSSTTQAIKESTVEKTSEVIESSLKFEAPIIQVKENKGTIISPEKCIKIKYSLDGKDIRSNSKIYREPFDVEDNTVIKAVAFYEDGQSEQVEYIVKG